MAHHIPKAPGYLSMLKDGARYFRGIEDAIHRNVEACRALGQITRSSYGPLGMKKMIINHIERKFITKDAATILKELEISHPAAKILILASEQQEQECGEATNFVVLLATALLEQADQLIYKGVPLCNIIEGYTKASIKALEIIESLAFEKIDDVAVASKVAKAIQATVKGKTLDYGDFLGDLISEACTSIMPNKEGFISDHVRIVKILGGGVEQSHVIKGMVFRREIKSNTRHVADGRIVVYSCPFDLIEPETTGTILMTKADELIAFSRDEEENLRRQVEQLARMGVRVVVSGGKIGDLALHYADQFGIMVVRLTSKWDIRRICRTTGAKLMPNFVCPAYDEDMGRVSSVYTQEIGNTHVVIFENSACRSQVATIVLRGSMEGLIEEMERAVEDGINTYRCLTQNTRLVAGAGAMEMEVATQLQACAPPQSPNSMEQYAWKAFAKSFEEVVRHLINNSGEKSSEKIAELIAAHRASHEHSARMGFVTIGPDAAGNSQQLVADAVEHGVHDLLDVKHWAVKYATDAAITVLNVDYVIMARPAGGVTKPTQPGAPVGPIV